VRVAKVFDDAQRTGRPAGSICMPVRSKIGQDELAGAWA
jgi:hypothetical protein